MSPAPPGVPRVPGPHSGGVPLERNRAMGMLVGLLLFGGGFVVAAVVAATSHAGNPAYLASVTVAFIGIGMVGFFLNRGTVPLPEVAIWKPDGLAALARGVGWPTKLVQALVYGLIALGVLGNIFLPTLPM